MWGHRGYSAGIAATFAAVGPTRAVYRGDGQRLDASSVGDVHERDELVHLEKRARGLGLKAPPDSSEHLRVF